MAIILRTAYFFNPFCIKQVPINCSKVNPMEQKYFVLANNVFSDGCGGYLTIGTEITLADTIGKNSEDWGLLLHVAGGGEDYWITGTAAEFRTDCECVPVGLGYIEYEALLTQTGLLAPVETILSDSITGITPSYLSVGHYKFNKTGAFPLNKTTVELFNAEYPMIGYANYRLEEINIDFITIGTYFGPGYANGLMDNYGIRIRVYN